MFSVGDITKRCAQTKGLTQRKKAKLVRTQEAKRQISIPSGGEDNDFLLTIHGYDTRIAVGLKSKKQDKKFMRLTKRVDKT